MNNDQLSSEFSAESEEYGDNMDGVSISIEDVEDEDDNSSTSMSLNNSSSTMHLSKSTGHGKEAADRNSEEIRKLAARETNTIRCWRFVVLIMILAVGAGVAAGAWIFLNEQEEFRYEDGVSWSLVCAGVWSHGRTTRDDAAVDLILNIGSLRF